MRKAIKNLVVDKGRCMTGIDFKLQEAIEVATDHGVGIKNIIPKREKGRITGYYVINEGGETAIATIK